MSFKSWFRKNLVAGVLVLVPLLGTVGLFWWLFGKVTGPGYTGLLDRFEPGDPLRQFLRENELLFRILVLFAMLGLTLLIGALARNFLGKRIIRLGGSLLERIPVVKRIYKALKQMSEAFWGENKTVFKRAVAVEYPREGLYTLGFVMSSVPTQGPAEPGGELLNIFLPSTPNITVGWFVVMPEKQTIRLDMTVEDAMKMIVSAGVVVPRHERWLESLEARLSGKKDAAAPVSLDLAGALRSGAGVGQAGAAQG